MKPQMLLEFEKDWQKLPYELQKNVQTLAAFWIFKHALTFSPEVEDSENLLDFFPYLPTDLQQELYYFVQFLILQNQNPVSEEEKEEHATNYLLLQRLLDPNPVRNTWEDLQTQLDGKLKPVREDGKL